MFKSWFLLFLLAHVLGDFYLQSDKLARGKDRSLKALVLHFLLYALPFLAVTAVAFDSPMLIASLSLAASHLVIDGCKALYLRKGGASPERERAVYIIDQALHLAAIGTAAFVLAANGCPIAVLQPIRNAFAVVGLPMNTALSWLLLLLLILKPANITIAKLLSYRKPRDPGQGEDEVKSGAFIGMLERLIIAVFLSIGQYAAIGLVLTAKSIARYDKIAKDQKFAEYYLLGTLLSTALVVIFYLMIF